MMNPHVIRESLLSHKGERVKVKIYGMRNKNDEVIGILQDIYPQLFTVDTGINLRTFSYSEIISGEVVITYI